MRRFLTGTALGLLLAVGGLVLLWPWPAAGKAIPPETSAEGAGQQVPGSDEPTYVLVLGVDERPDDPGRSDTIFLVRIADHQVRLLSIPRDTLVDMGEHGEGKVNSAYTYGGPELAMQTVSDLLGLPVRSFVKVNLNGFREMVDLIGGVPTNVEQPMYYEDPYDGLVINLEPGEQVLNGRMAEQYVRFRHDAIGDDLGRISRQQGFLKAAARHALRPSNLPKLPNLLLTASRYVQTNLSMTDQLRLATEGFMAQQADAVVQETLPGTSDYLGELSFYIPDQVQLDRLVDLWR